MHARGYDFSSRSSRHPFLAMTSTGRLGTTSVVGRKEDVIGECWAMVVVNDGWSGWRKGFVLQLGT